MTCSSTARVLAVLKHEISERVPIILVVSNPAGIKIKTYQAIKALENIQAPDEDIYQWPELGTARIDKQTMQHLRSDVRGIRDNHPALTLKRSQE